MAKLAIVTGGASGIGQATVSMLAERGWMVAVFDITLRDPTEELCDSSGRGHVVFYETDVSDVISTRAAVERVWNRHNRIDALINNAGILTNEDGSNEIARVISVNLVGPILLSLQVIPLMIESGGGSVVNISSIVGHTGSPLFPAYSSSKAGLMGLTRSLARRFGRSGIRVNTICPGSVTDTNLMLDDPEQTLSTKDYVNLVRKIPIGRIGRREDIANLICFLLTEEASHITGANIVVDGGEMINV